MGTGEMRASDVRQVLAEWCPLLFGSNSDRVAPVHVVNGFLSAACGTSDRSEEMREVLYSSKAQDLAENDTYPFLKDSGWVAKGKTFKAFQEDFRVVLDPDRRAWVAKGSLFPVNAYLVGYDPSDDGFGGLMWAMLEEHLGEGVWEQLSHLVDSAGGGDPVSCAGEVFGKDGSVSGQRRPEVSDEVWFVGGEVGVRKRVPKEYARFIANIIDRFSDAEGAVRLKGIQHLARALQFIATLAATVGPLVAIYDDEDGDEGSVADCYSLLVWTGMPPGSTGDAGVQASMRSIEHVAKRHRRAIGEMLVDQIEDVELPSKIPAEQRVEAAFRQMLMDAGVSQSRAKSVTGELNKEIDELWRSELTFEECIDLVLDQVYDTKFITDNIKNVGKKVGFTAPSRRGQVRAVCETPLLATVVGGLLKKGESCRLEEFVDRARERLGVLMGVGSSIDVAERLDYWESGGMAYRMLVENEERLGQRLVRAGLAQEYSDGNTVVGYE